MRIAGLVLGILGGLTGLISAVIVLLFGGVGEMYCLGTDLSYAAIPAAIMGLVGAALSLAKPKAAGILMIISAAAGVCFIYYGYLIPAVLLLVGGIFALIGQRGSVKRENHC